MIHRFPHRAEVFLQYLRFWINGGSNVFIPFLPFHSFYAKHPFMNVSNVRLFFRLLYL